MMELLVERDVLTPSGKDFLIAALDPMHDNQLKELQGWPDVETASSVVRCIKQTQSISGKVGGGNWDLSLDLYPFLDNLPSQVYDRTNNTIVKRATPAPFSIGGLCGYRLAPGAPLDITSTPEFQTVLNDVYSKGAGRIVGLGIEVVNTTSALNKQGQVTVWRQSNGSNLAESTYSLTGATGAFLGPASVIPIQSPPLSSADAMLIPGSRQWAAEDGCYIVAPFVGQDNPPTLVNYDQPTVMLGTSADGTFNAVGPVPSPYANTAAITYPVPLDTWTARPTRVYPLHQCGAYFQGLSEQTTLAITMNVYIETFPTVSEPDILVLATPSAEYDPKALQIFSHALSQLPVGVPAGWNVFGDWFTDIVSTLSDWFVGPATLANPAIGAGVAAAGALAKGWRKKQGYDKVAPSPQSRPMLRVIKAAKPPKKSKGPAPRSQAARGRSPTRGRRK